MSKKQKIQASDVEVGNRTLDAVLLDLAEQSKQNAARSAEYAARMVEIDERSTRAEEQAATALQRIDIALQSIAAVHKDLLTIAQRTDARLDALEKAS